MFKLWNELECIGPGFGYFTNARKTVLIVKEEFLDEAKILFGDRGVVITTQGQRHLGAALGSEKFREKYVNDLVSDWVKEVEVLYEYVEAEPCASYAAFTYGLVHRWNYYQRTIPDSGSYYEPLETAIREN